MKSQRKTSLMILEVLSKDMTAFSGIQGANLCQFTINYG